MEKWFINSSNYFNDYSIIHQNQFGFPENKPTQAAILKFTDYILKSFDDYSHVVGFFCLDLAKAFDTVDRKILLKKLEHYGIRDGSHRWFERYLKDRK